MPEEPEDKRQWLTKSEIISLFTTDLKEFLGLLVKDFIKDEMTPYHDENRRRFEMLEGGMSAQNVILARQDGKLATIEQLNVSQNREITNIGSRQAERYVEQREVEERAAIARHEVADKLQQVMDKMHVEANASAKRDGRAEMTDEYWSKGKKVAGSALKVTAGALGLGAIAKWLWLLLLRLLHHF